MLPKVATTILHSTTRAVTSIQHQSITFRNVLQPSSNNSLAPWNTPGSSHWGNNGTGPGSAKYSTGSRYSGYTGAGRAVTHANATISSNDGSFVQSDDQDDVPTTRRPAVRSSSRTTRIRSSSLSIPAHGPTDLGVLKTVQLHARSRHAFAPQPTPSVINTQDSVLATPTPPPRPLLRRNSTSAPPPTQTFDPSIPAPSPPPSPRSSRPPSPSYPPQTDPAAPQSVRPPKQDLVEPSHTLKKLIAVRDSGDPSRVAAAVREFRQQIVRPSVREFNLALEALHATRRPGEPINFLIDTYNDMLRHSLLPNVSTYIILIDALTARDNDVHTAIVSLEGRIKHRQLTASSEVASEDADRKRIAMLRREVNFPTAMSLFETLLSLGGNSYLSAGTYAALLRSCSHHGNVNAAIHVFAQHEKRETLLPSYESFLYMIRVYANAGQLKGAEEIFNEYRSAVKSGNLYVFWGSRGADPRRDAAMVWNQMIETYFRFERPDKAVALVEEMLNADDPEQGTMPDPPPVSTSTFTTIIAGFCQTGDVATALVWFDRLLAQQGSSPDPYAPMGVATKPDDVAWGIMLDALAVKGMVDDLNRLFVIRLKEYSDNVRFTERRVVHACNIAHLANMNDEQFLWSLNFLQGIFKHASYKQRFDTTLDISLAYLDRKFYDHAFSVLSQYFQLCINPSKERQNLGAPPSLGELRHLQLKFTEKLYQVSGGDVPYSVPLELNRIASSIRIAQPPEFTALMLHSYGLSRASDSLPISDMNLRDWELLLMAASELEHVAGSPDAPQNNVPSYAFQGLSSLIRDLAKYNVHLDQVDSNLITKIIVQLNESIGIEGAIQLLHETGFATLVTKPEDPAAVLSQAIENASSVSAPESDGSDSGYASVSPVITLASEAQPRLRIDNYLSQTLVDEIKRNILKVEDAVVTAYAKFRVALEAGRAPTPSALSYLIQTFGRVGRMEEMHNVYSAAQRVLATLEFNKSRQTDGWFQIENAMVIGLAHHGDVEGAHVHRQRMLQQGGAPDADAYGALIYNVKDTTDDASNALELFQEAQMQRVTPNVYLFNNIISKLARARKTDYAMELFQQMKGLGLPTTSVTFGAVIGACARVGDVHSAELLFDEMTKAPNFRPRIPPYNTMMQMYTMTKPDRERVLHFYNEMGLAGISPTAHTYKLLLDAYGTIEPVDIASMNTTFKELQHNKHVPVQGTHYASLINAHGCVSKDLDSAIKIFETMSIPADNIVYETMINVLVAHRRADLFPVYINKMHLAGVHMTAYIANALIKGYALVDKLQDARDVFESLEDPAVGVAAPNNHVPHSATESAPLVDQNSPVYREPSTWEAMIRAELGAGNRDGAIDLLERLKARQYPEAVYNRISGILIDHSQVPL